MYYDLKFRHIPYVENKFSVVEFDADHNLMPHGSTEGVQTRYNVLGPVMLPIQRGGEVVQFNWYLYFLDSEQARTKILETLAEGKIDYDFFTKFSEAFTVNSVLSLGEQEHNPQPESVPLVRLHSCCATGDIFGSCRCDCGPQLDAALKSIADNGYGAVLYLSGQEGRGIGLFAKALTYLLQECGHDTYEANSLLKLPEDARTFDDAGRMLKFLYPGKPLRLMTNSPHKIEALRRVGVDVVERVELVRGVVAQNEGYLRAKAARGHMIELDQHQDQPPAVPSALPVLADSLPAQAQVPRLAQLLQTCSWQEPEYRGGLSSHLPMALIALAGMGADSQRLAAYAAEYSQRMALLPPATAPAQDWRALRGQIEAYPALLAWFQQAVAQHSAPVLLRKVLPQLMPGVGAAAFHGLIRLAYGVLARSDSEIAAGLAYFAARYLDLGPLLPVTGEFAGPDQLYHSIAGTKSLLPPRDLIFTSMQDASQLPGFAAQVASVQMDASTLAGMARCALQLFNVEADFVALHMVTSCHALRLLLPYFADPVKEALPWMWQAHLAAFYGGNLAQQTPMRIEGIPNAGFNAQHFAAFSAQDDHCIKMVFACLQEAAHYGDPHHEYQQAAQRVCNSFG